MSPVSSDDVNAFCNFCVSMRSSFRHFQILFEGSELQCELLQQIAPTFFGDIHLMIMQDLLLQICKITDPEEMNGYKNLSIDFLVENSDFLTAPDELNKLRLLAKSMKRFRRTIVPARNKIIGHLDRKSVLDGKPLGAANKSEWDNFWLDLQDFLNILHKRYIHSGGHFYLNGIANLSDADQLVKALKESAFFHILASDPAITNKCTDVAFGSKFSGV